MDTDPYGVRQVLVADGYLWQELKAWAGRNGFRLEQIAVPDGELPTYTFAYA